MIEPDPAIQRQQAALVLSGHLPRDTQMNGIADKAFKEAGKKFAHENNEKSNGYKYVDPNDPKAISNALDAKMRDPSFRDMNIAVLRADKNLTTAEVTGVQWLLKEAGDNLPNSTKPNGLMDGKMGAETQNGINKNSTRVNPDEVAAATKKYFATDAEKAQIIVDQMDDTLGRLPSYAKNSGKLEQAFGRVATGAALEKYVAPEAPNQAPATPRYATTTPSAPIIYGA